MNIGRIKGLIIRHLYSYARSVPRLMDIFFWPVMDLLILGFLSLYLNSLDIQGVDIVATLVGAVVLWQIVDRSQNALSTYFLEDVWYRNFLNIFVTPLTLGEFFMAGSILSVVRMFFISGIMFLISIILYKFNLFTFGIALVPYVINLFLFGIAISLFINAIILRFGSSAQVLAFGIAILVQPVSAVYYPVSSLPEILQYIAYALPSSYVFESLREITSGGSFMWQPFFIASVLNVLYLAIMWMFFVKMFKKVKVMGKLLKVQD